jgi:hypothetical protein
MKRSCRTSRTRVSGSLFRAGQQERDDRRDGGRSTIEQMAVDSGLEREVGRHAGADPRRAVLHAGAGVVVAARFGRIARSEERRRVLRREALLERTVIR